MGQRFVCAKSGAPEGPVGAADVPGSNPGGDGGAGRASAYLLRGGAAAARVGFFRHVRPRRSTDDAGACARARLFGPFPSSDLVPKVNNWFTC